MSVLVVGLSHASAPVPVLEQAVLSPARLPEVLTSLLDQPEVGEALVLSTCNRVELYVEVPRFHPGLAAVSDELARSSGLSLEQLAEHLYVHWEDRAAEHLFAVAAGLDSMVVGEPQVLGQLREAYAAARDAGSVGRVLHELVQAALHVGKRVRAETGLERAGADLVSVALDVADEALGGLAGRQALVVGAGSMGALAGAWLRRRSVASVVVANRSPERGARLALALAGRPAGLDALLEELVLADVVVTSTGATGTVLDAELVAAAVRRREGRPLALLDLALPRDVDPLVRGLTGVTLVDLETLQASQAQQPAGDVVAAGTSLVATEVASFLAEQRSTRVTPTVVALRARASEVVESELSRLAARLPQLDAAARAEVERTVQRVVSTLLHAPTVRVKELAAAPGGDAYADALRQLFDLDPATPAALSPPVVAPGPADALDAAPLLTSVDTRLGEAS